MVPAQKLHKPGNTQVMELELGPHYADEGQGEAGVTIAPARTQSLGLRVVDARMGSLGSSLTATGTIDFNQRDVAIVQARASGFVQRVYNRAQGDVIGGGAPLADLPVPDWAGRRAE